MDKKQSKKGDKMSIGIDDVLKDTIQKEQVQSLDRTTKPAGRKTERGEKADQRVTIYLTKSQLDEVEKFCFNNRLKVGTYIKDVFFEVFNNEKRKNEVETLNIEKYLKEQNPEAIGKLVLNALMPKK